MVRALAFKTWSFEVLISKSLGAWGLGVALSRVIGWTLALRILLGGSWVFISGVIKSPSKGYKYSYPTYNST